MQVALLMMLSFFQQQPAQWNDFFPAWSPDGSKIVFQSNRSGDDEIYVMNADGSGLRQLTNSPGRDAHPAFSPDGKTIAFQSPRGNENQRVVELYLMNPDGSNQRRITLNNTFSGVPDWSPDGKRILFQARIVPEGKSFDDGEWHIFIIDADGKNQRQLSKSKGNFQVPRWSPDGKKIVYWADVTGNNEIYLLDVATWKSTQLTDNPADDIVAGWTPDGKKLSFTSNREGDYKAYIMNANGSNVEPWTGNFDGTPGVPTWSPDGKKVMMNTRTEGGMRIFIADTAAMKWTMATGQL